MADPIQHTGGMNANQNLVASQQLELTFAGGAAPAGSDRRNGRRTGVTPVRAQWWFNQIRQVLAQAAGRTPPGRPEQAHLTLPAGSAPGWSRREPDYRLSPVWQS